MRNKKEFFKQRIQIGTSSLILIFTILCLVIFSTLSLTSAKADYKLAVKNEQSIKTYYKVDNQGEILKRDVNKKMINLASQANSNEEFKVLIKKSFDEAYDEDKNCVIYKLDAGSQQFLLVEMRLSNYNEVELGKENYKIMVWTIQNKFDYEIDDNMPLWDGV